MVTKVTEKDLAISKPGKNLERSLEFVRINKNFFLKM